MWQLEQLVEDGWRNAQLTPVRWQLEQLLVRWPPGALWQLRHLAPEPGWEKRHDAPALWHVVHEPER